ncbi:MAG: ATP-binding protein [Phycisphaerales bacterium]|nr:ATP-binding protein [Phycisphaerales bacterium]
MINKPIDFVTADDLRALINDGVREARTIEYKRELPGSSDSNKKEYLADVSSFANAAGGDLLFGIEAQDGVPIGIPGLAGFNEDKERLRLESIMRDGLDPRIPGLQLKAIDGFENGPALLVRIPRSWCGPHMITFRGSSRFLSRSSAGKFQMDMAEIRSAIEGASGIPERIRRWRDDRLGRIVANEGPILLASSSCLVLHVVPLESFASEWRYGVSDLDDRGLDFHPLGGSGWTQRFNVDGLMKFAVDGDDRHTAESYTQVFRSGRIEAVAADLLSEEKGTRFIASVWYEETLIRATKAYLKSLNALSVQPPVVVLLSITGAKGAYMEVSARYWRQHSRAIDRDMLLFPDVLIEQYDCDVPRVLRPTFDAVWNACGFPHSPNYDEDGNWSPR